MVAAEGALVKQANSKLTVDQVERVISSTSVDLGDLGFDPYYGWGRIDVYRAVMAAKEKPKRK